MNTTHYLYYKQHRIVCKHANWEAPIDTCVMLCIAPWNMSIGPHSLHWSQNPRDITSLSSPPPPRDVSEVNETKNTVALLRRKICFSSNTNEFGDWQVWDLSSFYSLCWGALWATTHEVCRRTALNQNSPFPSVVYGKVNLSSCGGLAVYFGVVDGLIAHVLSVQVNNANRSLLFNFICCHYR